MNRIKGLDSIRFVCALWVTIGHLGVPPIFGLGEHGWPHLGRVALRGIINEQAAVIVFFLVSGFCIHYPQRGGRTVNWGSFYTRRLIRISLPLLLVIPLGAWLGVRYTVLRTGIFWSLIAEIVYYLLYPLLLGLAGRFGWKRMIGAALGAAAIVLATQGRASNFQDLGDGLTWILGLSCWLLGCLLAQGSEGFAAQNARNIWWTRVAIIGASCVATVLRWHTPHLSIGFPWTLNVFAIAAFFWLRQEIIFFRHHSPPRWLESAGVWSYSLYLMHIPGANLAQRVLPNLTSHPALRQITMLTGALLSAYLFFLLVERPAHLFAVRLSALFGTNAELRVPELASASPDVAAKS